MALLVLKNKKTKKKNNFNVWFLYNNIFRIDEKINLYYSIMKQRLILIHDKEETFFFFLSNLQRYLNIK